MKKLQWLRGAITILASCFLVAAHAAAPQIKTQAPGFYRTELGDFEVTALFDGSTKMPFDTLLTNTTPEKAGKALARNFLASPVETSVNCYLINTGTKLILIDTGGGKIVAPSLGGLVDSLKAAGYKPEQVDEIYITHMHSDHVGGLVNGDKIAFPNAIVRADEHDADYWLNQANLDKVPVEFRLLAKSQFDGAMASLNPYVAAGKFKPFDGDTELSPGIKAIAAYGHTPGHSIYKIESKGQALVLLGDIVHLAAVQFPEPAVGIRFDSDSKNAALQRKHAYAEVAQHGYMIGSPHLSFPGLGHLRAEGKGYVFVPLNYSSLK